MAAETPRLIVIADDDPDVLAILETYIGTWGYRTAAARTKAGLMALLFRERPTLVLLDLRFGDTDGMELLGQLLGVCPDLPVALLTGHASVDAAVTAMRLGAYDFLTKPPDLRRLRVPLNHAADKQALAERVRKLEARAGAAAPGLRLLGDSPAMAQAVGLIRSVAPTDATVRVLGESGTGKELAAQTVHEVGRRAGGPFVPLNMAALPRELAESLLFGHEKGTFTGADRAQPGACELADKGTPFLDEVGELDLALQAKLLRFRQERTVQRVGNPRPLTVDVRVVAATNRDLADRVRAGQFREDLYYRLNVVPVKLPPLRDRRPDVAPRAARFLQRALLKYHRDGIAFSPEALDALTGYDWPGNVRQLENLVERLAILAPGPVIGPEAFADEFAAAAPVAPPGSKAGGSRVVAVAAVTPPAAGGRTGCDSTSSSAGSARSARSSAASGRATVKQLPTPGALRTAIVPPSPSTSRLQMLSPSPVPPYLRVVDGSAWTNGRNSRPSSAGVIPHPWSSTSTTSRGRGGSGSTRTRTSTARPGSVNLTALSSRFNSTCRNRVGSVVTARGRGPAGTAATRTRRSAARAAATARASVTARHGRHRTHSSSTFPASIFDRSSTSLMSRSRCPPFRRMARTCWVRSASPSRGSSSMSAYPMTAAIGVRTSWLMFARNCDLATFAASASPLARCSSRSASRRRASASVRSVVSRTNAETAVVAGPVRISVSSTGNAVRRPAPRSGRAAGRAGETPRSAGPRTGPARRRTGRRSAGRRRRPGRTRTPARRPG